MSIYKTLIFPTYDASHVTYEPISPSPITLNRRTHNLNVKRKTFFKKNAMPPHYCVSLPLSYSPLPLHAAMFVGNKARSPGAGSPLAARATPSYCGPHASWRDYPKGIYIGLRRWGGGWKFEGIVFRSIGVC